MILFDLKCGKDHQFEAWFRDGAAYDSQSRSGKIACPVCGSRKVEKALMAPRIGRRQGADRDETKSVVASEHAEIRRQLMELRKKIEENCDYVGDRFADEARRIHEGEVEKRDIYGEATDDEARDLAEDGIEFARIPWPTRHDS